MQASHGRSLRELLLAHKLVKVQINQTEQGSIESSGQKLADLANVDLLLMKGRTALFAGKDVNKKDMSSILTTATKGLLGKQPDKHLEEDQGAPVTLSAEVQLQLQHMRYSGMLALNEPDSHCMR